MSTLLQLDTLGRGAVDTGAVQSGYLAAGLFVSVDGLFFRTARRAWRHILARAKDENCQVWVGLTENGKTYLDGVSLAFYLEAYSTDIVLVWTDENGAPILAESLDVNVHEFTNE